MNFKMKKKKQYQTQALEWFYVKENLLKCLKIQDQENLFNLAGVWNLKKYPQPPREKGKIHHHNLIDTCPRLIKTSLN